MNSIVYWLVAGLAGTPTLNAQLYVLDHFDYADGPLVSGSGSVWHHHSGTTGSLLVNGGAAFVQQASEGATTTEDAHIHLQRNGANVSFAPDGDGINDNNCLFAAFTVAFSALPGGRNNGQNIGSSFAQFRGATTLYNHIGASLMNASPGTFRLGISSRLWTQYATYVRQDLVLDHTYSLITRFNLDTQASTLWLDPVSIDSPSVTFVPDATVTLDDPISTFALRQGTTTMSGGLVGWAGDVRVDNLRVGSTFAEVITPVPEPSAWTTLGAAALLVFTASHRLGQTRSRGTRAPLDLTSSPHLRSPEGGE